MKAGRLTFKTWADVEALIDAAHAPHGYELPVIDAPVGISAAWTARLRDAGYIVLTGEPERRLTATPAVTAKAKTEAALTKALENGEIKRATVTHERRSVHKTTVEVTRHEPVDAVVSAVAPTQTQVELELARVEEEAEQLRRILKAMGVSAHMPVRYASMADALLDECGASAGVARIKIHAALSAVLFWNDAFEGWTEDMHNEYDRLRGPDVVPEDDAINAIGEAGDAIMGELDKRPWLDPKAIRNWRAGRLRLAAHETEGAGQ